MDRKKSAAGLVHLMTYGHTAYCYLLRGVGFGLYSELLVHVPVFWVWTCKGVGWLAKFQFALLEIFSNVL